MITIIHPTRGRKKIALDTAWKWLACADDPFNIEYIFSVDNNDTEKWTSVIYMQPKGVENSIHALLVTKNDNNSAIGAINNAAKVAAGDILIVVSDDTDCPEHWDTLLLKELEGKSDFCAKVDDGLQPTLVTMPVMDRIYYERYNYIYNPNYFHMFCDQELTAVAIMTDKYLKLPLTFNHLHYSTGKSPKDAINEKNDLSWPQGEGLFNERLKTNFGIPENEIVKPYSSIQWR